ncbi:MAG: radical SAM family heme chaperone HemW [Coriobacteriia bacterium]|nr:radical SAM family heme chaperone HemW [Coriobacteriia bacterium]
MPHDPYKALYLHIPFCVKRCDYCDFTTQAVPATSTEIDAYVDNLVLDIRRKAKEGELAAVETVYLGGGTPTHIGSARLSSLLYALSVSMRMEPDVECTMEANPESLTPELVKDVWALGVNRLSLGVQSFDDAVLATLGRAHTAKAARDALAAAGERFANFSIDLMCGIPGQSVESFRESVRTAVDLDVPHISVYPLTVEKGTPFYKAIRKGKMLLPDEDVEADMMELAATELTAAGYERYEVASYAKPGHACRHNIAYWTGVPYLGLGTSAATMTQNSERRMRMKDGFVTDDLNPAQMAAEDLMLGMRMARGVSESQIEAARELLPNVVDVFQELIDLGLATPVDGRVQPTTLGWLCGNELYERIYALAD